MPLFHLGPAGDAFAGAFGGIAALLLIGGPIALRWQRNRQQFALAQAALAQGETHFPKGHPLWLTSLRQGLSILTLGIALLIVGSAGVWLTWNVPTPAVPATQPASINTASATMSALPAPGLVDPGASGPARAGPPQPNPEMDDWHRLKAINTLSLMVLATGFVLMLLGIMRIAFVRMERRYQPEDLLP